MGEIKTVNVKAYLEIAGQAIVDALGKTLPREVDASKHLRKSIKFTIKPYGLAYYFDLHLADYYQWVDKGRKPGKMPPVSEIIKWTTNKHLVFDNGKLRRATDDKKSKLNLLSKNLSLQTKIAWAIARGIAKHGTKATNFYTPVVDLWIKTLKEELPKAYGKDILITVKEGL
jgi:hypothetical protein